MKISKIKEMLENSSKKCWVFFRNFPKLLLKLFLKTFLGIFKLIKKTIHIIRNPKIAIISCRNRFLIAKRFFKRLPRKTREYFFFLIMSPHSNVLRLRRKNIQDIPTTSEIKEYQTHLRKKTFKTFVMAVAMVVVVFSLPGLFQKYFAQSKGYSWVQTSWIGGAFTDNTIGQGLANAASYLTTWSNYYSKSGGNAITANGSGVTLTNVGAANVTENTSGTYTAGVYNDGGNYSGVSSATSSGVYSKAGTVTLRKPAGASCSGHEECAGRYCLAGSC